MSEAESIGAALKLERERQGISLDEVSESTKITIHNLAALEEDRFELFPNRVYARAFLRDYANFLGLESASLLERYESMRAASQEAQQAAVVRHGPWRAVGIAVIVCLIVAGLGGAAYVGWWVHGEYKQIPVSRPATAARTRQHPPVHAKATQPEKPSAAEKPSVPEEPQAARPQPPPARIALKFTALANVWVDLRRDGKTELYAIVPKGYVRTFEADRKIYVRVGRANAARLELNGERVLLPSKSAPVTMVFRPSLTPPSRR